MKKNNASNGGLKKTGFVYKLGKGTLMVLKIYGCFMLDLGKALLDGVWEIISAVTGTAMSDTSPKLPKKPKKKEEDEHEKEN